MQARFCELTTVMVAAAVGRLDRLWCYWPGYPELLVPVGRDDAYIERLLKRELDFWKQVQRSAESGRRGD
jgi:hypothetical protein